jgi:iron complex outermembrane receptor protein
MNIPNQMNPKARLLRSGASMLVLGAMLAAFAPSAALAQDAAQSSQSADTDPAATQADDDTIIVTGQRKALQTSQQIKRDADTVVDSITATDIGSFPDKSVAEALQRVAGITVNRFAASDDTAHFSAEPSGVIVRGLSQVRNEFNGRDVFSANSSRGLGWGDISPELLGGVDTYKNQTAEMIEGGIAGTVNLRTRLPFDSPGQTLQISANANYGDISKKLTPDLSGIYSNRWQTGAGEFGVLINYAYSHVETASQGIQYGRTAVFDGVQFLDPSAPGGTTASRVGPAGMKYIPSSVTFRDNLYDRTRNGLSAAVQWKSNDGSLAVTGQYQRSLYKNTWRERAVQSIITDLYAYPVDFVFTPTGANQPRIPLMAPGTQFKFDDDGNFVSGSILNQQTDFSWWGASDAEAADIAVNSSGQNMLHPCYNWGNASGPAGTGPGGCGLDARGPDLNAVTRLNQNRQFTQDASFNLKWEASERLRFNFDAQYVSSDVNNYDVEIGQYSFANLTLDQSSGLPRATFSAPYSINQSAGGLSNPNNYRYNHAMDHLEDSHGEQWALRLDGEYDIGSDWLDSIKVGARYADRDQDVRWGNYNWGNIANNWNIGAHQYTFWNIDSYAPSAVTGFTGYPKGLVDVRSFGGDFFGGNLGNFAFFNMDQLENHAADMLSYDKLKVGQDQWRPTCTRVGELPNSCFRQEELNQISETTKAAYAMLRFGGPNAQIGGLGIRGNIGIRYVETKDRSSGAVAYPLQTGWPNINTPDSPDLNSPQHLEYVTCHPVNPGGGAPTPSTPAQCYASADERAFNMGGGTLSTVNATHRNWLPSVNLRIDLSPKWLVRFAASKAMSRPDIGLLKNYVSVGAPEFPGADPSDPRYVKNSAGQVTGVNPTYTANAYNPNLKPTTATQFDLAIENYFASVGSFTITAFYKNFDNYIQYGSYVQTVTNNGVTRNIAVRGPLNGDGAEVLGAEVAYTRYFDFLPGALKGLGIQANYTYVENHGITNSNVKQVSGGGNPTTAQPGSNGTVFSVDALEGLSKHSFNVVGMYEWKGLSLRAAYNWRSSYLVTAVDCCVYLPVWSKSQGFLDASIRYGITQNFELSLQATNLLNTKTVLLQQVTDAADGAVKTPNAWFQNDRRFVAGIRFKY